MAGKSNKLVEASGIMTDSGPETKLMGFYKALLAAFGDQHWWPGDTPFEVMVGAILTQNTNWSNVEKAIGNLKKADMLCPRKMDSLDITQLAELIRPAGYFNIKAKRLKNFVRFFCERYDGDIARLAAGPVDYIREQLLSINGIGPETADSIILYALEKPVFVVDTYTYRILTRHECVSPESGYDELKEYCQAAMPTDVALYNQCHALFVRLGKEYCKPKPKCLGCPLENFTHRLETDA
jgi:endonuclease III related protein